MLIGRLGIKLAEFGRFLQVRYANWNAEFRLKHSFLPSNANPDYCIIHVSERVIHRHVTTFDSPGAQPEEMTPMVHELFGVKGVSEIILRAYEVSIIKGSVFSWEEILPQVEAVILKHLTASH